MQDAINTILGIMSCFPDIYKIGIVDRDNIIVYWTDEDYHEKSFTNAIDLLEWCENNLVNGEAEKRIE